MRKAEDRDDELLLGVAHREAAAVSFRGGAAVGGEPRPSACVSGPLPLWHHGIRTYYSIEGKV